MNIQTLLADMTVRGASDLYLNAGNPPIFRIEDTLHLAGNAPALTPQQVEALLEPYLTPDQKQAAWEREGVRQVSIQAAGITVHGEVFPMVDISRRLFTGHASHAGYGDF